MLLAARGRSESEAYSQPRSALSRLLARKMALLGMALNVLTVAGAILAPWLTAYEPNMQMFDGLTIEGAPLPPGGAFALGTDLLGRDLLTRILYGARTVPKIIVWGTLGISTTVVRCLATP